MATCWKRPYRLLMACPPIERSQTLPNVLVREEVARVLAEVHGVTLLMAQSLYGSDLRLQECVHCASRIMIWRAVSCWSAVDMVRAMPGARSVRARLTAADAPGPCAPLSKSSRIRLRRPLHNIPGRAALQ